MAIACGLVWWVIDRMIPFLSFSLLLAPAIGYAIGKIVSLSVNRKRSTGLAIIAGIAVVISYLVSIFAGSILFHYRLSFVPVNILHLVIDLVAVALGIFVAITQSR